MIFKGVYNQSVEFEIKGYQFPNQPPFEGAEFDWDRNWLNIYIKVQSDVGNWQTIDPSLTTTEVESLIKWFADLSENKDVVFKEMGFTEPNLTFDYLGGVNDSKKIRISFELESKPKSAVEGKEYYVDCVFNRAELAKISEELRMELSKFPPRDIKS